VPIFKQRRLTELTRDVVHRGSQAVVEAVVEHAFQSTRGERELFDIIDVASKVPLFGVSRLMKMKTFEPPRGEREL